jgi:hypothetical protein
VPAELAAVGQPVLIPGTMGTERLSTRARGPATAKTIMSYGHAGGRQAQTGNGCTLCAEVPWEESFGIVMIETIGRSTPPVAVRGGTVPKVVGGVTGPAAWSRHAARNFGVGQFGSGHEKIDQEVARKVAGRHLTMRQVVKPVEPQRSRVSTVDQQATV